MSVMMEVRVSARIPKGFAIFKPKKHIYKSFSIIPYGYVGPKEWKKLFKECPEGFSKEVDKALASWKKDIPKEVLKFFKERRIKLLAGK